MSTLDPFDLIADGFGIKGPGVVRLPVDRESIEGRLATTSARATRASAAQRSRRAVELCALALALVAAGAALWSASGHSGRPRPLNAHVPSPAEMSATVREPVSAALGAQDRRFWARRSGNGAVLGNPAQGLSAALTGGALTVTGDRGARVRLVTLGVSRGASLTAPADASSASTVISANRVSVPLAGIGSEWVVNGPWGVEQSFTVIRRPMGVRNLRIVQAVTASGPTSIGPGGQEAIFGSRGAGLRYGGLRVSDARGRRLPARMTLTGARLSIEISDAGAAYPITVDPTVQRQESAELTAPDGGARDAFGTAVAASGSTIVVGAPSDGASSVRGAAYVFTVPAGGGAPVRIATLTASDGAAQDSFGASVAISGSTVVVGAPAHGVGASTNVGAAYVFTIASGGASQTAELTPSDGAQDDRFGSAVAVDGSTLVVGAPRGSFVSSSPSVHGSLFVYSQPPGGGAPSQLAELRAPDTEVNDGFGTSVAISGSTIVTGAPNHRVAYDNQGAAYVFSTPAAGGAPVLAARLTAPGTQSFGYAVAASGSTVVVGAPRTSPGQTYSEGAAYVYSLAAGGSSLTQTATLTAPDAANFDLFGTSVAVAAESIVVGATGHQVGSHSQQGAAYAFTAPTSPSVSAPAPTVELTASDGAAGDRLGTAAAISGATIVAGAPNRAGGRGSAYTFPAPPVAPPPPAPPPPAATHSLTVVLAGDGGGTVTGPGISCQPVCSATYPAGTKLTLTATPAAGSVFAGWGGDCAGTGPCQITENTDHEVTASFTGAPATPPTGPPPADGGPPAGAPDLALSASHADPLAAGEGSRYQLLITNRGSAPSGDPVTLAARLPAGITYLSASGPWTCDGASDGTAANCRYTGRPLDPGATASLELLVRAAATARGGPARFTLSDPGDSGTTDKSVTDPTTVAGQGAIAAFLSGPSTATLGATTPLGLVLANRTRTRLDAGASAEFRLPTGVPADAVAASGAGPGWSCATIAAATDQTVHCDLLGTLAPDAAAPGLTLSVRVSGAAQSGTALPISATVRSATGALLSGPLPHGLTLESPVTSRAALSVSLTGTSRLQAKAQSYAVSLSNAGSGPTTAPAKVVLTLPADVSAVAAAGNGWTCATAPHQVACVEGEPLVPAGSAAPLKLGLVGTPGAPSPVRLEARVTAADAAGPVSGTSTLALDEPLVGIARPVVTLTGHPPAVGTVGTTGYTIRVGNQGDAPSRGAGTTVQQTLPSGVSASATGSGWTCAQTGQTLGCRLGSGLTIPTGRSAPPISVTVTGAGSFAGGSVPLPTTATLPGGGRGSLSPAQTSSTLGTVGVPPDRHTPVVVQLTLDRAAVNPGDRVNATLSLLNQDLFPVNDRPALALLLPPDVGLAGSALMPATPWESLGAAGQAAATPLRGGGAPGMSCQALPHERIVECFAAHGLPPRTVTSVHVPLIVSTLAAGPQEVHAGTVSLTGSEQPFVDMEQALRSAGASALSGDSPAVLRVNGFTPVVGSDQRLPAAAVDAHGTPTPTSVTLDGSQTADGGQPLGFGWVQTSGPRVRWESPPAGQTPGPASAVPAFPPGALLRDPPVTSKGGSGTPPETLADPDVYGARAKFTLPNGARLTAPVTLTFQLFVTDGSLVRTAVATVTLDPPPPAPPIAPVLCLRNATRDPNLAGPCLSLGGATPAAGDVIVAAPIGGYTRDAAGDSLTYSWTFTDPAQGATALRPGDSGAPAACGASDTLCFAWPQSAPVVNLTAAITNGRVGAQGQLERVFATASAGSVPRPLALTVTGPTGPVVPGSTVTLTASVPGGPSHYHFVASAGPAVSDLTASGAVARFTAPAPTATASSVTIAVSAERPAGAATSTGERSVTIPLLAPAPLAARVTAAGGGPLEVAPGQTLSLRAAGQGGAGAPYTYAWSTGSGSLAPSASDPASAELTAPANAGMSAITVTVTDRAGTTARTDVPVTVGSSPSVNPNDPPSSDPCGPGGPLGLIYAALTQGRDPVIHLGPFTVDLGAANGPAPSCQDIANASTNSTLSFHSGTSTAGAFTVSDLGATLSRNGIELRSGTIAAPAGWSLGSASISTPIEIPFSGHPSGAITWSGKLPFLAPPGGSAGAATTLTLRNGAFSLEATVPLLDGTATITASPLPSGATDPFTATVRVARGQADGSSGNVVVAADGTVTSDVTLRLKQLPSIAGVSIDSAILHWDKTGLRLSAEATAEDSIHVHLDGSYVDSDHWTATLSGALAPGSTPPWLAGAGVSLDGARISGTVSNAPATGVRFDLKLDVPQPWRHASGGSTFVVTGLSAELANTTPPPAACGPLSLTGAATYLAISGGARITPGAGLPAATLTAAACFAPGSRDFALTASGLDGYKPLASAPLTIDHASLTVLERGGHFGLSASGQVTLAGVQAAGTLRLLPAGGVVAVAGVPDLSQVGLPLPAGGASAAVIFSTVALADLANTDPANPDAVPSDLFARTGIDQRTLHGVSVAANSVEVVTNLPLGALSCVLDKTLYANPCTSPSGSPPTVTDPSKPSAPAQAIVTADIGAGAPKLTATLPAGPGDRGLELLSVGHDAHHMTTLAVKRLSLTISADGSVAVAGAAALTFPTPGHDGSESTLELDAGIAIDATGPAITLAATAGPSCANPHGPSSSTPSALCNLFGADGLDLKAISVQLGINFASPVPTPTFGLAGGVTALPCRWAATIHYVQDGCHPDGTGVPNPDSPLAEPISLALNISQTAPILAIQIGVANHHPVLDFGTALSVDDASFVFAPLGGTIGVGPNAVTFRPGFSLDFDAKILNVPVAVHAAVDPLSLSVSAHASVGEVSVGPVTLEATQFDLDVRPSVGVKVAFSGGIRIPGADPLEARLDIDTAARRFALTATGGHISAGPLALTQFQLSADGSLAGGLLPTLDLKGSAVGTVLGHQMALAGGVSLSPLLGITGASLFADPGDFDLAGVRLTGSGCGRDGPPGLPATGPCIGASFDPGASNPFAVTLTASVSVAGLGVNFAGTVDATGIDIPQASVTLADPLDPAGTDGHGNPPGQTLAALSGRLWLGPDHLLAGLTAVDANSGTPVQVHNGDFVVAGRGGLSLAGLSVNGSFFFGRLAQGAGPGGGASVFAHAALGVDALGASVSVSGSFGSDANGLTYDLAADGAAFPIDGYPLLAAHLELSSASGLTVSGSLNAGGLVTASVRGNVGFDNGTLLYRLSGSGSASLLGVGLGAEASIANESANGMPLGSVEAGVHVHGDLFGVVHVDGQAQLTSDGKLCPVGGSVVLPGVRGSASYCAGRQACVTIPGDPAIGLPAKTVCESDDLDLDFQVLGFNLHGSVSSDHWRLSTSVAPDGFNFGGSFHGVGFNVQANWAFAFSVDSQTGLDFHVDGSASISGHVGPFSGSLGVRVHGDFGNICAGGNLLSYDVEACADSHGVHFTSPGFLS